MKKLIGKITENPKNDILSGLTVALALVPEAVGICFCGWTRSHGRVIWSVLYGHCYFIFGGRPGMISGATGAMAVVMVSLIIEGNQVGLALDEPIQNLGVLWIFIALLLVGLIQISAGFLRLGKFVRLIPHPVMMGFVNGLAIVIFLASSKNVHYR